MLALQAYNQAVGHTVFHRAVAPSLFRLCSKELTQRWNRQLHQRCVCSISVKSYLPSSGCAQGGKRLSSTLSIFGHDPFDDYEKSRKQFSLPVPEYFNFATDVIDRWAGLEKEGTRTGNTPALWWTDDKGQEVKWSFQQLSQYSKQVANVLTADCGLRLKDRMIVILPRVLPWWLLNLAAIRAGVVLSPGTTLLTSKDILHRLLSSQASCIVTDANCAGAVDEVADQSQHLKTKLLIGPESRSGWLSFDQLFDKSSPEFKSPPTKSSDPMMLFFTSGTTGDPKMAEHTHASYGLGHLITAIYGFGMTSTDVIWNLSDTGWAKAAWSSIFSPWISGACVFQQNSARFDPRGTLEMLSRFPITLFCAPPTALRMIITEDMKCMKPKALRRCVSGGEPVNPEILEGWREGTGTDIYELFGQTETTCLIGTFPCIEQKPGSMGKACPGVDIEIVDNEGNIVPQGQEGVIGVRCKPNRPVGLFSHYVDDPERNASVFKGDFYLTGDKAVMDEDGYVWFVGRADDIIMSAGYRIGPFEVESALLEHPGVAESAVVSSPDKVRKEVVKAFIILTEAYKGRKDEEGLKLELQEFVKKTTSPYKYPRKIEFVDQLPKTVSGKIRRVELRNREWNLSGQL